MQVRTTVSGKREASTFKAILQFYNFIPMSIKCRRDQQFTKSSLQAPGEVLKTFQGTCEDKTVFVIIMRHYLPVILCWHLHWWEEKQWWGKLLCESRQWPQTALMIIASLQLKKRFLKNANEVITINFISSQLQSTWFSIFYITKWEVCILLRMYNGCLKIKNTCAIVSCKLN